MEDNNMTPKHDFRVLIAYPNLSMMLTPSYAVGLFTTVLKEQSYNVDLFDCTPYMTGLEFLDEPLAVTRANKLPGNSRQFDPQSIWGDPKTDLEGDFTQKLDDFKPHVVVFSTLVEDTWPQARDMLAVLSQYPEIRSIVGGIYSTMAASNIIVDSNTQCVGEGEGEATIVEFCETVRRGESPLGVPGTRSKDATGKIVSNPPRPLVDVNQIIPDFSLFDERRFFRPLGAQIWKAIPLETYRGCPYTCAFCNSPAQVVIAREKEQGYFLRRKNIDTLRREIETMIDRHSPEFFYINDDAFMARPKDEIAEFAEMYKDFKIPFWFQTRFEDVDAEKLSWLKEVGCYRISFGLEHGNEQFRRERLLRRMTNEFILKQAEIVFQVGIPYTLNNIIGFPFETRELFFDTVRLNREIKNFDSLSVNIFVPYHGTPLREMAIKEGWLDPNKQTSSVISESILDMPPPYLSSPEILSLQRVFPLYVNMPEEEYPKIRRAETRDQTGNDIFDELSAKFYIDKYGQDEANRKLTYSG
jgi:radical SAM superfamily enzyme YgiQ (UPF0313 family)